MSPRNLQRAPVEPLSYQAWQRVEAAVFERLDGGVVLSMPLPYVPSRSSAAARSRRPRRWAWAVGMGLSISAAAAASVIHIARSGGARADAVATA
jgi:hypothetical protein